MGCDCDPGNIPNVVPYGIGVPFAGFMQSSAVVPAMYWDVYSAEQRWKTICCNLQKLIEYADAINVQVGINKDDIAKLQTQFEKFMQSGFFDYYAAQIEQWVKDNLAWLWQTFCKQVFFGLTDDGYFCAYVPDSWADIEFDTGAVFGRTDYGRLILRMETNGEGVIDNTYSYSLNSTPAKFDKLIADLEVNAKRTDSVFDTIYTNLDSEVSRGGENV